MTPRDSNALFLTCVGTVSQWKKILAEETLTFTIAHTFQKQSSLSQYELLAANGVLKLSVPTKKKSRKGMYDLVEIDYQADWQAEHWKSIDSAYLKSPFYLYYGYRIEEVYMQKYATLLAFNTAILACIWKCLKVNKEYDIDSKTPVYFADLAKENHCVYPQTFDHKHPFASDLSVLDVLFNLGPEALDYLSTP